MSNWNNPFDHEGKHAELTDLLNAWGNKIMTALTDLAASVVTLGTDISADIAEVTAVLTALAAGGGANPATNTAIEAAVTQLNALDANIKASTAAMVAAVNPPITISIAPASLTLSLANAPTGQLVATPSAPLPAGVSVVWSEASAGVVATVDQTGKVTAVAVGTDQVTATAGTDNASASVTVTA